MRRYLLVLVLALAACGPDDATETQAALAGDTDTTDHRGPKGDPGERGPAGPQGPQGKDGDPGAAGTAGKDGTDGAAGQDGTAGQDGLAGTPGAPGAPGADGDDAVRQWFEHPDGTYIGDIVGIDGGDYFVRREVAVGVVARFKVTLSGQTFAYSMNGPTFYFPGAGCTGTPFTARSQVAWLNATRTPNGTMYVAHGPTVTELRTWSSVADVSGNCTAISSSNTTDWVDAQTWTLPLASLRADIKP